MLLALLNKIRISSAWVVTSDYCPVKITRVRYFSSIGFEILLAFITVMSMII